MLLFFISFTLFFFCPVIVIFFINVYSYRVLVTSDNSGLIETIRNTMSVHSIKKNAYTKQGRTNKSGYTLRDFYIEVFLK